MAGGTSTCETSTEKFFTPWRRALKTAIALAGAVVSETDGEEDHALAGVLARPIRTAVERRVDHAHVRAAVGSVSRSPR